MFNMFKRRPSVAVRLQQVRHVYLCDRVGLDAGAGLKVPDDYLNLLYQLDIKDELKLLRKNAADKHAASVIRRVFRHKIAPRRSNNLEAALGDKTGLLSLTIGSVYLNHDMHLLNLQLAMIFDEEDRLRYIAGDRLLANTDALQIFFTLLENPDIIDSDRLHKREVTYLLRVYEKTGAALHKLYEGTHD